MGIVRLFEEVLDDVVNNVFLVLLSIEMLYVFILFFWFVNFFYDMEMLMLLRNVLFVVLFDVFLKLIFFDRGGVLLKMNVLEYDCEIRLFWFLVVIVIKYFILDLKIKFVFVLLM